MSIFNVLLWYNVVHPFNDKFFFLNILHKILIEKKL